MFILHARKNEEKPTSLFHLRGKETFEYLIKERWSTDDFKHCGFVEIALTLLGDNSPTVSTASEGPEMSAGIVKGSNRIFNRFLFIHSLML